MEISTNKKSNLILLIIISLSIIFAIYSIFQKTVLNKDYEKYSEPEVMVEE